MVIPLVFIISARFPGLTWQHWCTVPACERNCCGFWGSAVQCGWVLTRAKCSELNGFWYLWFCRLLVVVVILLEIEEGCRVWGAKASQAMPTSLSILIKGQVVLPISGFVLAGHNSVSAQQWLLRPSPVQSSGYGVLLTTLRKTSRRSNPSVSQKFQFCPPSGFETGV